MSEKINIVVGFDQREAIAYHTFTQSIIEKSSIPVFFMPLAVNSLKDYKETHKDRDNSKALLVVKHNYQTKKSIKYLGNINENYPRKNWSSLILWNCAHPKHKTLTPEFIANQSGKFLHRFSWLDDQDIGELPVEWNWLAVEYPVNTKAKIIHYTLGTPCFKDYRDTDMSENWFGVHRRSLEGLE